MKSRNCLLLYLLLLGVASCRKASPSFPSCTTSANTITVTDAGKTYCAGGRGGSFSLQTAIVIGDNVEVSYDQVDLVTYLYIDAEGADFHLSTYDLKGPLNGVGIYAIQTSVTGINEFQELFSGGQSYSISGGTVNVSNFDSTNITGTFSLNISNTSGSKVITGSFNADHPAPLQ